MALMRFGKDKRRGGEGGAKGGYQGGGALKRLVRIGIWLCPGPRARAGVACREEDGVPGRKG